MRKTIVLVALALVTSSNAQATSCSQATCAVGERLTVYAAPNQPAAACPTQALTAYVNYIYGAAAVTGTLGRAMPKNFKTVEARLDGKAALKAKSLHAASGVASINEGIAACKLAGKGTVVTLLSPSTDGITVNVQPVAGGAPFWIPLAMLDKRKAGASSSKTRSGD